MNGRGERLLLHIGIIDILQSYRWAPAKQRAVCSQGFLGPRKALAWPPFSQAPNGRLWCRPGDSTFGFCPRDA